MAKKRTEISLDEKLKTKAKEKGINLSKLFNDYLKEELELLEDNKLLQINHEIRETLKQIDQLEIKLQKLLKIRRRDHPRTQQEKVGKVWRELRIETYRKDRGEDEYDYHTDFVEKCENLLGRPFRELLVIAFWFRDCRSGTGERFDKIVAEYDEDPSFWTMKNAEYILKNVDEYVPE